MSVWPVTPSTTAAMVVLRAHRAAQIALGRQVAGRLIQLQGETNCREVWGLMRFMGILDPMVKDHWLGALFNDPRYEWTGKWVLPTLPNGTLIHAQRPVKVWTWTQP